MPLNKTEFNVLWLQASCAGWCALSLRQ